MSNERTLRFKEQARSRFDCWAETYDRSLLNHFLFRPAYLLILEEIARWRLTRAGPFSVLDIGCGTGAMASLVQQAPWAASVTAMDYSQAMCATAAAKARRAGLAETTIVAGDSERLPFRDSVFDVVTCANSFHHYPRQQVVVCEMRRVLRPGGRLILVDGYRDNAIGWFVFDVVIGRIERDIHHSTWREIDGFLAQADFKRVHRRKTSRLFPIVATIGDV